MSDKNSEPSKQELERLSLEAFEAACFAMRPLREDNGEYTRVAVRLILAAFHAVNRLDRAFRAEFFRRHPEVTHLWDTVDVFHVVASAFLNESTKQDEFTAFSPESLAGCHLLAFVKATYAMALRHEAEFCLDDPDWHHGEEFSGELLGRMAKTP